jgi:hypothetical protein
MLSRNGFHFTAAAPADQSNFGCQPCENPVALTPAGECAGQLGKIGPKEAVMIELTHQQRQELSAPEPTAVDPETRQEYVLLRREAYERIKELLALDDYDPAEGAAYINEIMAEDDARDPYLESYQQDRKEPS